MLNKDNMLIITDNDANTNLQKPKVVTDIHFWHNDVHWKTKSYKQEEEQKISIGDDAENPKVCRILDLMTVSSYESKADPSCSC